MCEGAPANVTEALARLRGALNYLNRSDAASLPGEVQAEVLRELERAQSRHTPPGPGTWRRSLPKASTRPTGKAPCGRG